MDDGLRRDSRTGYTSGKRIFQGDEMSDLNVELAPAGRRPTSIVRPYHFRAARGALGWTMGEFRERLEAQIGRTVGNEMVGKLESAAKIDALRVLDVYFATIEIYQANGVTFTERGIEIDPAHVPTDKKR